MYWSTNSNDDIIRQRHKIISSMILVLFYSMVVNRY